MSALRRRVRSYQVLTVRNRSKLLKNVPALVPKPWSKSVSLKLYHKLLQNRAKYFKEVSTEIKEGNMVTHVCMAHQTERRHVGFIHQRS